MAIGNGSSGRRPQATLREVAEAAGVSQMTVSRALNQPQIVSRGTRERVLIAADALNYRPNLMARSLAGGSSLFIGLVCNNPSNSYLSELLVGALRACRAAGHHLVLDEMSDQEATNPREAARRLRYSGLDGVLLASPRGDDPALAAALRAVSFPYVLISPGRETPSSVSVTVDDEAGAVLATRVLLDAGHRRIGMIEGATDQMSSRARRRGFERALTEAGLTVDPDLIVPGEYTYRSGMKGAERLLSLQDRPTAIYACNDDMAAGALAAGAQIGLQVPRDLSIVGFDDTLIASTIWPGLTTIRQPISALAERGVELLAEESQSSVGVAPRQEVLDLTLVERGSVAPPR